MGKRVRRYTRAAWQGADFIASAPPTGEYWRLFEHRMADLLVGCMHEQYVDKVIKVEWTPYVAEHFGHLVSTASVGSQVQKRARG